MDDGVIGVFGPDNLDVMSELLFTRGKLSAMEVKIILERVSFIQNDMRYSHTNENRCAILTMER